MNKTVSLRDDVLAAIDSIDNVVTESEIDVLVSMLGATDKAVSIMENYSGDELGSFGIFMEDGENNSGNEKKDESVLKSIVMLPIRLLQSLWKLITGQFNKESVETTKAAAIKVEDVEPGIFNGLLDFFKRDDGSTNGVKVGGVVLTAAAVAALATYKTKFKDAESNATGAISTALSKLPKSSSSYSGLNANDMKFDIKGENDNKTIETNISLDGCVGFIDAVAPYINNFNNLNGTKDQAVAKIDKTYESAILTKKTNTYAFGDFANRLGEIQTKCADLTKGDKLKNVENAIARGDNTGNGRNGVAEDNSAVAQKFGEMTGVLLAMVTMLNTINAQHREISDAITQGAQQVQQAQQDQQNNNNNQNGQQPGSNNSQNGQTEPGQNPDGSVEMYTILLRDENGKPVQKDGKWQVRFNSHGSTTDTEFVRFIDGYRPGKKKPEVIDESTNKLTDTVPIPSELCPAGTQLVARLDKDNTWKLVDGNVASNKQLNGPTPEFTGKQLLDMMDPSQKNKFKLDKKKNVLITFNKMNEPSIATPIDIESGDHAGETYIWNADKNKYILSRTPDTQAVNLKKGMRLYGDQVLTLVDKYGTDKQKNSYNTRPIIVNGQPTKGTMVTQANPNNPSDVNDLKYIRLNGLDGIYDSNGVELIGNLKYDDGTFSYILESFYLSSDPHDDDLLVNESDIISIDDSDELVQEEFEVDPVASTWYSK